MSNHSMDKREIKYHMYILAQKYDTSMYIESRYILMEFL